MVTKRKIDLIAIFIAVLPILRYFKSPVGGFDNLGMVVLSFIIVVALIKAPKRMVYSRINLVVYCIYMIVFFFMLSLFGHGGSSGMGTLIYNILILLVLVCLYNRSVCFSIGYMLQTIRFVSSAASVVLALQYVTHYLFNSYIMVFPLSFYTEQLRTSYSSYMRLTTGTASGNFRPASFFNEPSHFATYVSIALVVAIYIFVSNRKYKHLVEILIYSVALFMTTSGIGLISVVLGWGILALHYIRHDAKLNFKRFLLLLAVMGVVFFVLNQNFAQYGLARLFSNGTSVYDRRLGGYECFLGLDWWNMLFGVGMGREPLNEYYFTTLSTMLTRVGIMGIAIYITALIRNIRNNQSFIWWLDILYVVIIAMAGVDDFTNVAFYSMLVFADYKNVFKAEDNGGRTICV